MIRLRELRKQKGVTMKQLGDTAGLAESTISLYETGKRQPDQEMLVFFAKYFNVSIDYLLGREGKTDEPSYQDALNQLGPDQRYIANAAPLLNEDQAKVIRALLDQMGIK